MPKTSSRRFLNLLRAFGVAGAGGGDELRFPLAGTVTPIVDADAYDPAPIYGIGIFVAAVAAQQSFVEIKAKGFLRLIGAGADFDDWAILTRGDFTPGGVPLVQAPHYSSDGTLPDLEIRTGTNAAQQLGVSLSAAKLPALQAIWWADRVIRFQGLTLNTALKVSVWLQSQRAV